MKAILVLDEMPSNCSDCICRYVNIAGKTICRAKIEELKPKRDKRPDWCPLRELPKKKPTIGKESDNDILCMNAGYNACIDEILGDEKNE